MAKRLSKKAEKAAKFRAIVETLRLRFDVDWRPYEERFLESQTRRPDDYDFTDPQWRVLNQLVAASTIFTHYSGRAVPDLIRSVYRYSADLGEGGEEFIERHHCNQTTALPVRDVRFLARLYRQNELLEYDESVEAVFCQTWDEDVAKREIDEFTAYSSPG